MVQVYVNIITGSGVMTICFYRGLTRNPEIGNNPVWVLFNIWRMGWVRNTKFGTNVSNEILLNPEKYWDYIFYPFWVNKGKPTGGNKIIPSPRLGLKEDLSRSLLFILYWESRNPLVGKPNVRETLVGK